MAFDDIDIDAPLGEQAPAHRDRPPQHPARARSGRGHDRGRGHAAVGGLTLGSRPAWAQGVTDADLFNFALNFEYLGAEYYLRGLTGQGLPAALLTGTGTQGTVAAGGPVPFQSAAIAQYVQRLAVDELGHVQFIRAVLGATAIAEPAINLSVANWSTLAIAAGLIVPGQTFNPYASDVGFLLGAYVLEDVCVTALAGAARYITNPNDLAAAAGLLGVEGYQAGGIRTLLANVGAGAATDAISALRARLSGVGDNGTLVGSLAYNFTNTDTNALVLPPHAAAGAEHRLRRRERHLRRLLPERRQRQHPLGAIRRGGRQSSTRTPGCHASRALTDQPCSLPRDNKDVDRTLRAPFLSPGLQPGGCCDRAKDRGCDFGWRPCWLRR